MRGNLLKHRRLSLAKNCMLPGFLLLLTSRGNLNLLPFVVCKILLSQVSIFSIRSALFIVCWQCPQSHSFFIVYCFSRHISIFFILYRNFKKYSSRGIFFHIFFFYIFSWFNSQTFLISALVYITIDLSQISIISYNYDCGFKKFLKFTQKNFRQGPQGPYFVQGWRDSC